MSTVGSGEPCQAPIAGNTGYRRQARLHRHGCIGTLAIDANGYDRRVVLFVFPLLLQLATAQTAAPPDFTASVAPFLANHCIECHSGAKPKGDLDLSVFTNESTTLPRRATWLDVRDRLVKAEMPPAKRPHPAQADVDAVVGWIDARFPTVTHAEPAHFPALRRLNRTQYANTIRDLFGVDFDTTTAFPSDDVGYGFDDIGDVLSMPDMLLEKYLSAAQRIAGLAVMLEDPEHPPVQHVEGPKLSSSKQSSAHGHLRVLFTNGETGFDARFAREGEYVLRARVWGQQAGTEACRAALKVGREEHGRFDVPALESAPQTLEARFHSTGGTQHVAVAFLNDFYDPNNDDPKQRDRNLEVVWLELVGPVDPPQLSQFQRACLDPAKRGSQRDVIAGIARRAWRRPVARDEVDRLVALAGAESGFEAGVRVALEAILVSPNFLFMVETDPPGASTALGSTAPASAVLSSTVLANTGLANAAHPITDPELATRLSYFLWSSTPDAELMALADANQLHDPSTLKAQTARLLRDARSSSLAQDFAGQWLQTRSLERVMPDPLRFPDWDEHLASAMRAETEMFFDAILREDRRVDELLDSDFTYLDEALAKHYGIPGVRGDAMRRVHLEPGVRGGVLGLGSVLTVTSNPTRTSPVKRGKWILENLLDAPTPPPPPGVGVIDESAQAATSASLRERLVEHRKNTDCAACHARLDPLGFGLENFDATGAWRASDEGHAVDARGDLPDGRKFEGPAGLKAMLKGDGAFTRCLALKLATYALGRGMSKQDEALIEDIVRALGASPASQPSKSQPSTSQPTTSRPSLPRATSPEHGSTEQGASHSPTLQELIEAIVTSDLFRTRTLSTGS